MSELKRIDLMSITALSLIHKKYLEHCTHMYKSLVFGDEFVAQLKSHQRCSAAFCRPVKFFHTD